MSTSRQLLALAGGVALAAAAWTTSSAQQGGYGGYRLGNPDRLSGTYQLDRTRSDNPQSVVDRATRSMAPQDRDRVSRSFLGRLQAPDMLSIDLNGRAVTLMSSDAPRLTFDADGRDRTEPGPNGRMMTTHADLYGDELTVTTSGVRGADFTVRFEPVSGGLQVTRNLDSDYQQVSVTAVSYYRRLSDQPRWNLYGPGPGPGRVGPPRRGVVPDGTILTARLDRAISTRTSREGERFTATVTGPGPYRGAVLNGVVARVEGRPGHADIVFDFDRIQMNDGRSSDIEGEIQSVRTPDGNSIRVDRAGVVHDPSRPNPDALQNGAVGAGIGAIIGAIVGGGKGAAVGAVVGGAGTLAVEGRDFLDLPVGSEITFTVVSR